ncbi:hypothetical protein BHYA_0037g00200 [Botrytis hyacinthi]|uniref:Uncharacterized protein n=1 Tax=Botrytis hyacinthi TaxID=278943 RepID=A0A4Z1GYZ1_9HELO|nr:hypothetical protein BHYA_0037g00200 [Botrytis hyacinthi]
MSSFQAICNLLAFFSPPNCESSKTESSPSLEGSGVPKLTGIRIINPSQNLVRTVRIVVEFPDMSPYRVLNEASAYM